MLSLLIDTYLHWILMCLRFRMNPKGPFDLSYQKYQTIQPDRLVQFHPKYPKYRLIRVLRWFLRFLRFLMFQPCPNFQYRRFRLSPRFH